MHGWVLFSSGACLHGKLLFGMLHFQVVVSQAALWDFQCAVAVSTWDIIMWQVSVCTFTSWLVAQELAM